MMIRLSSGDVDSMKIFVKHLRSLLVSHRSGKVITSDMLDKIDYLSVEYSAFICDFFQLF